MAKTLTQEFTKGLWAEVPPYRLGPVPLTPTTVISLVNGAPELIRQGAGEM